MSTSGVVLQLAAVGEQDVYLTGNPQNTHFKSAIKRYTNFSMESIRCYFDGSLKTGERVCCTVRKIGDLLANIHLTITLPSLYNNFGVNNLYVSWINNIGFALIESVDLQIGDQLIDRQYGQWMYIWSELTSTYEQKETLTSLVGRNEVHTYSTSTGSLTLNIPFYFWFCKNSGVALPLIALQNQEVRIWIQFRTLKQLWISNNITEANKIMPTALEFTSVSLLCDYIFLDNEERVYFAQNTHHYMIEQLQIQSESIDINKQVSIIEIPFNHPVKELFWVIQGNAIFLANDIFNFSDDSSDNPQPPIQSVVLRMEGTERFQEMNEYYFRKILPNQYHTSTSNNYIYMYSFALSPEELQPTGTANFSRIDRATLHITISNIRNSMIYVYATNYNLFQIKNGSSGVVFLD
jgi:hypothetical protein